MRHILPDRCGFSGYNCVGLIPMQLIKLCSDSKLYDKGYILSLSNTEHIIYYDYITPDISESRYISDSSLWPSVYLSSLSSYRILYDNIDNIPRFSKGPVRLIELVYDFSLDKKIPVRFNAQCYTQATIFSSDSNNVAIDGFKEYSYVLATTQKRTAYDKWCTSLITYKSSQYDLLLSLSKTVYTNYPGILTPLYVADDFKPQSAIVVPVTINSTSSGGTTVKASQAAARTAALALPISTCAGGCGVTARFVPTSGDLTDANGNTIKISKNRFSSRTAQITFRIAVAPCALMIGSTSIPLTGISQDFTKNYTLQTWEGSSVLIYAHVYLTVVSQSQSIVPTWVALIIMDPSWLSSPTKTAGLSLYNIPIAKVTLYGSDTLLDNGYYWCVLKVLQTLCGPLLLRDTFALIGQPTDPNINYVLYTQGASTQRNWIPLVLCSS